PRIVPFGDETLIHDTVRHTCHALNPTGAFLWRHGDGVKESGQGRPPGMTTRKPFVPSMPQPMASSEMRTAVCDMISEPDHEPPRSTRGPSALGSSRPSVAE